MDLPLVSVICLSYNHAPYIEEAVESVMSQTYQNIELIIVDDNSTDNSREIINKLAIKYSDIKVVLNEENSGNCKSFNVGFRLSKGEFLIDLAADDILLSERIETGIKAFQNVQEEYGVHFTDAEIVDSEGKYLKNHYKRNSKGSIREPVPQGYIYSQLLERYHICAPTMMFKRLMLEDLAGYDENLAYEDFDLWVRSSKKYKYVFTDMVLVKKRILVDSHSKNQYIRESRILESTYRVCKKAESINDNERDRLALVRRVRYELKQAILSGNSVAEDFYQMLDRHDKNVIVKIIFRIWIQINKLLSYRRLSSSRIMLI